MELKLSKLVTTAMCHDFVLSIALAFILGVELIDYLVDEGNYQEPDWGSQMGDMVLRWGDETFTTPWAFMKLYIQSKRKIPSLSHHCL